MNRWNIPGELEREVLRSGFCVVLAVLLLFGGCSKKPAGWSEVRASKDGSYKSIGTTGLALSLGPSGKIEIFLGPNTGIIAPTSPQAERDSWNNFRFPVGVWVLEKGNTRIVLPRNSSGTIKTTDYYENVDTEIWEMLVSPGCATLKTATRSGTSTETVVEKAYRLCEVDIAANLLRK